MSLEKWAAGIFYNSINYNDIETGPYVYYSHHRNEIREYWFKRNIPKSFVYIGQL